MEFRPHSISWNITKRCNLRCAHCYLDASDLEGETSEELRAEECFRIIDQIAEIDTDLFLILTGGEPLLREDILDIARYASERDFTVVMGTNGTLIDHKLAGKMVDHGVRGVGISLDSLSPHLHDAFRGIRGAWEGAIRGIEALKEAGLEFVIQTTVTKANYNEIPGMIEFSHKIGARAFNLFFLVCTGRGESLTDITSVQYEDILSDLYKIQGRYGGRMLVRAKCAPHYRRIVYENDPNSHSIEAYSAGCPAGTHYCRISPEGDVTPCPYMPLAAGNLRDKTFPEIWRDSEGFRSLRNPKLRGRCGECEFGIICGGCRARAYAFSGDYLGEDPQCEYQPGRYGHEKISLEGSGLEIEHGLSWTEEAKARLERVPSFVRKMVVTNVERFAREKGFGRITPEIMKQAREELVGGRGGVHTPTVERQKYETE